LPAILGARSGEMQSRARASEQLLLRSPRRSSRPVATFLSLTELPPQAHLLRTDPPAPRFVIITGSFAGHGKESGKVMTDFTRAGRQGAHAVEPMRGCRFATARRERSALPRPATP
jgi:hypothetical protein